MLDGKIYATFGEVHPDVRKEYDLEVRAYVAQVALDKLFELPEKKVVYRPLPKFPAVQRDFALLCDEKIPVAALERAIRDGAGRLCEKIQLFDVYTGAQMFIQELRFLKERRASPTALSCVRWREP